MQRMVFTPRRLVQATATAAVAAVITCWLTLGPSRAVAQEGQPSEEQPSTQPGAASTPVELDEQWLGEWKGRCQVLQPGGLVAGEFSMALTIRPQSPQEPQADEGAGDQEQATPELPQYNWTIVYDNGQTEQAREYLLKPAVDESGQPVPGHYIIDEQNGIVVDQFLIGDTMQGHFIVASGERQTVLHARYALREAEDGTPGLLVEIASYDGNFARSSSAEGNGVVSRPMRSLQTGLLLRQGE